MNYYSFLEFLVASHLSVQSMKRSSVLLLVATVRWTAQPVQRTVACSHSQGVIHVFWHIRIPHKLSFDICVMTHQVYGSCEVGLSNA